MSPLSRDYPTYHEARAAAQLLANQARVLSAYVAKPTAYQGWTIGFLPRPENRAGFELQVEEVRPEVLPSA